jgi:peroxiredoxin
VLVFISGPAFAGPSVNIIFSLQYGIKSYFCRTKQNTMMKKLILMASLLAFGTIACKDQSGGDFEVKGTFKSKDSATVLLFELPMDGRSPVQLDSVVATNGEFTLKGTSKEEGLFQLNFGDGPGIMLVNDRTQLNVEIDDSNKKDFYTVSGSPASESLRNFILDYTTRQEELRSIYVNADSLISAEASDSLINTAVSARDKALSDFNSFVTSFIKEEKSPTVTIFAIGMAMRSVEISQLKEIFANAVKKFPDHKGMAQVKATFDQQVAAYEQRMKAAEDKWVGKQAPAFSLPDLSGKEVSIQDFKGKYVLVDFWASWCGPCRQENPNVVEAYHKFKDKNFTILGVSLDADKEKWAEAVFADKLEWTHISDLKYWDSKAVEVFGISGIPYNILVDPDGKIIAENLRGPGLGEKLSEVLK